MNQSALTLGDCSRSFTLETISGMTERHFVNSRMAPRGILVFELNQDLPLSYFKASHHITSGRLSGNTRRTEILKAYFCYFCPLLSRQVDICRIWQPQQSQIVTDLDSNISQLQVLKAFCQKLLYIFLFNQKLQGSTNTLQDKCRCLTECL